MYKIDQKFCLPFFVTALVATRFSFTYSFAQLNLDIVFLLSKQKKLPVSQGYCLLQEKPVDSLTKISNGPSRYEEPELKIYNRNPYCNLSIQNLLTLPSFKNDKVLTWSLIYTEHIKGKNFKSFFNNYSTGQLCLYYSMKKAQASELNGDSTDEESTCITQGIPNIQSR